MWSERVSAHDIIGWWRSACLCHAQARNEWDAFWNRVGGGGMKSRRKVDCRSWWDWRRAIVTGSSEALRRNSIHGMCNISTQSCWAAVTAYFVGGKSLYWKGNTKSNCLQMLSLPHWLLLLLMLHKNANWICKLKTVCLEQLKMTAWGRKAWQRRKSVKLWVADLHLFKAFTHSFSEHYSTVFGCTKCRKLHCVPLLLDYGEEHH